MPGGRDGQTISNEHTNTEQTKKNQTQPCRVAWTVVVMQQRFLDDSPYTCSTSKPLGLTCP
eukprot:12397752-Karenia_brevis.AAC.1